MAPLVDDALIYDWNHGQHTVRLPRHIELDDETLRDGLQSPSAIDPGIEEKLRLLHLMDALGIDALDVGLPGAGPRAFADCLALAVAITRSRLRIRPNAAVRTLKSDVDPLLDLSMRAGYPVEAAMFIGSSPIRFYAEGWTLDHVRHLTEEAVAYATRNGIPVMFVTEDTTRTDPETIRDLFTTAIRAGARRVCVADTVGHATPRGVEAIVRHVRSVVDEVDPGVKIDWHGHSDRGLAVPNALAAIEAGVDRVHATGLGIGERCGNTPMDQLLVNLRLEGLSSVDLSPLHDYCLATSRATGFPIPVNYPAMGRDAFRTSTGVHAAAIVKARGRGARWLADRVYSGVPAEMVGREQEIEIGFMSGLSNVAYYLRARGIDPTRELQEEILQAAKVQKSVLGEEEVLRIARAHQERLRAQLERASRGLEAPHPDHPAAEEGGESGGF